MDSQCTLEWLANNSLERTGDAAANAGENSHPGDMKAL